MGDPQEKKRPVKMYFVTLSCGQCDNGEMLPTGRCLTTSPPMYPHKCNKCGHSVNITGKNYPILTYSDAETGEEI